MLNMQFSQVLWGFKSACSGGSHNYIGKVNMLQGFHRYIGVLAFSQLLFRGSRSSFGDASQHVGAILTTALVQSTCWQVLWPEKKVDPILINPSSFIGGVDLAPPKVV